MHDTDAHSRTKSWRWLLVVPIPVIGIVLVWIGIVSLSSPAGEHQPIGLSPLPSTPPDSLLLLTTPTPSPDALPTRSSDTPTPPQDVVVYITGAVNEPGVYQLPPDARVTDVVFAAGGLKGEAAGEYINLAAPIEDAQHIHVPRREDLRQQRVSSPGASYASSSFPTTSPPSANAAAHTTSYQWGQGNGGHEETSTDRININYASERELQELQGVGEVIAKRIIDYRTINGPFRSIDDLAHVRGIGSSLIENNQASLTVGVVEDGEKGQ